MTERSVPVYFDNSATTAVSPEIFSVMTPYFLEDYGNPNSSHHLGEVAAAAVASARSAVARALSGSPDCVYFTSGGTESDNWALRSAVAVTGKKHAVASAVEHKAVLATLHDMEQKQGLEFTLLPVDGQGRVNPEDLRRAVRPDTAVVSVMAANNELGTLQPVEGLYAECRRLGVLFHCDAVQAMGKTKVWAGMADMVSLSGHKLNGPKGVGVLYVRSGVPLSPLIYGGAQERGLRAGTTPTPLVVGMGAACDLAYDDLFANVTRLTALGQQLEEGIMQAIPHATVNGFPAPRIPGVVNVCFRGLESHNLVRALSKRHGICCSSGSACSEKSTSPSYVLRACGLSVGDCHASVRFSLGRFNTIEEVNFVLKVLPPLVAELRRMGGF
jgi:cysteine desulfurase